MAIQILNMLLRIVGSSKGSLHFLVLLWSTLERLVNPHKNSCKEQVPTGETVKKICDIEKVINIMEIVRLLHTQKFCFQTFLLDEEIFSILTTFMTPLQQSG